MNNIVIPVSELLTGFSPEGQLRYRLAVKLAKLCPQTIGQEVLLSGSTARGVAGKHSDIEINFFGDVIPGLGQRDQWLKNLGAQNIVHDREPIESGSIWSTFLCKNIWVEAGWAKLNEFEKLLKSLTKAEIIDHKRLMMGWVVRSAISLKTEGYLKHWQEMLVEYPILLEKKLIENAIEEWIFPNMLMSRWALARKKELLSLSERLILDTHKVLRIIFAMNHNWEPDWKWASYLVKELSRKPAKTMERINKIFTFSNPAKSVQECMLLVVDTLELLSSNYDVRQQLSIINSSIQKEDEKL